MKRALQPWLLTALLCGLAGCQPAKNPNVSMNSDKPDKPEKPEKPELPTEPVPSPSAKITRTDEEWRRLLTPEQYRVLRRAGTEQPFGPAYEEFKNQGGGTYVCAGCGVELFSSKHKFDSHCGWPSFYDPANAKNVVTKSDFTLGMARTEVLCAQCGGHLGHVFKGEGYQTPTDTRYCINGVTLKFIPAAPANDKGDAKAR